MEEFLKIKAEELDYLIEEREKIDNKTKKTKKDKDDLQAISNLIRELSEQLSSQEITNTSKELHDWNVERDRLDNKTRKNQQDKEEINDINNILKELSLKLKEMSNRKSIDEYEVELESSQNLLENYQKQVETLEGIKEKIDTSIYEDSTSKLQEMINQEQKILSYNERIISTYNLFQENNYKLNIISNIKEQQELKESYLQNIPNELQNDSLLEEKVQKQISLNELEINKLSSKLQSLTDEYSKKTGEDSVSKNRKLEIEKNMNIIKQHLEICKKRIEQNNNIISSYKNLISTDEVIKKLSSELTVEDTEENLSIIVEKCKRILPENLQDSALEEAKTEAENKLIEKQKDIEVSMSTDNDDYFDEEDKEEEEEYFDEEDKDDDFDSKLVDKKSRTIIDGPTKLLNEKPLEELLTLRDKYQSDIQYYKEKSNLNDPTLKNYVENLEQKLDEVQKIIDKKKLDSMQDKLMGAINNAYGNMKTSPTVNTSPTTSEENSKDENTSETLDETKVEEQQNNAENNIPEKELPAVIENSFNDTDSKKDDDIKIEEIDLNDEDSKEEKEPKKKFKIKSIRKSIKNIAKKTVVKISALAVTLVLIAAGAHSCSMDKKDTKQYNEVVDQIDNENGITTYKSATSTENNYDVSPVEQETTEKKTESYSEIESETQRQVNTELESKKDIQTLDVGVNVEPITEKSSETEEAISQYTNQYDVVNTDAETNNLDDGIISLSDTSEITPSEYNDDTSIHIGSEVTVDGNIHDDEYDAYYNENNQTSYYGTEPKRVVIGTGIVNDDGMNVIYAYNPDANQKIDELLNEGGEMVSILTANKEKYLQNYDGSTTLTPEEIKASAEGWYNINDVSINNGKGMSR